LIHEDGGRAAPSVRTPVRPQKIGICGSAGNSVGAPMISRHLDERQGVFDCIVTVCNDIGISYYSGSTKEWEEGSVEA
jgi:hypothetical protein